MSELSRSILAGTSQIASAQEGLANLNAVNRERKRKAAAGLGDSIAELGQTIKDYGSWKEARKAEDESRQVDDAYALGMQTGEPEKALVTLGAVRPTTAEGATLRARRMSQATDEARMRQAMKLEEAQSFIHQQQYERDTKYHTDMLGIENARLELEKARDARLGAQPKNIDPNSPEGIAAAAEKAGRTTAAELAAKAAAPPAPKEPTGEDQPLPPKTRALLEQKAGLAAGALEGFTFRDWNTMRSDPQEEMLKQLRIIAAQREAANNEPPKLKRLRKQYDDLVEIGRDIRKSATYVGGAKKLAEDTAAAKSAMDTAETEANVPVPAAAGTSTPALAVAVDPALKAEFDGFTPERQASLLKQMTPEEKAKVGR